MIDHPLFTSLRFEDQQFITEKMESMKLSFQHTRIIIEQAADLKLWQLGPLSKFWNEDVAQKYNGKHRNKAIIDHLVSTIDQLRMQPTVYDDFIVPSSENRKIHKRVDTSGHTLLGSCPCPASQERTRCCNLTTLDAVQQCSFACAYCSIQSFYHRDEIVFAGDLEKRLTSMQLPEGTWHIGTGQSSDSLVWGNENDQLRTLFSFAQKHPSLVLELKTKSCRIDWATQLNVPRNVVATWSLNAPTIAQKEEHATASVDKRLEAARKVADKGIRVGFHLHPLVHFKGWQEEYAKVVSSITHMFSKEEIVMISFGTLTFTKPVIRQLRSSGKPSRILQMKLVETAGKYSYSKDIKQTLFCEVYRSFSEDFRGPQGPFFYLCMEEPELWEPVLGRSYASNADFEADMKQAYYKKLGIDNYNLS